MKYAQTVVPERTQVTTLGNAIMAAGAFVSVVAFGVLMTLALAAYFVQPVVQTP